jgi:hypothetical protein
MNEIILVRYQPGVQPLQERSCEREGEGLQGVRSESSPSSLHSPDSVSDCGVLDRLNNEKELKKCHLSFTFV